MRTIFTVTCRSVQPTKIVELTYQKTYEGFLNLEVGTTVDVPGESGRIYLMGCVVDKVLRGDSLLINLKRRSNKLSEQEEFQAAIKAAEAVGWMKVKIDAWACKPGGDVLGDPEQLLG